MCNPGLDSGVGKIMAIKYLLRHDKIRQESCINVKACVCGCVCEHMCEYIREGEGESQGAEAAINKRRQA